MLSCHYCMIRATSDPTASNDPETLQALAETRPAVVIVDGESLCVSHWDERRLNLALGVSFGPDRPGWWAIKEHRRAD
jgi:hypothetical protein